MADDSLSRVALERVLARASELQANTPGDPSDTISEARLLEIAQEVGLDVHHVRQAMAEERAQLPMTTPERGPMLDALGEAFVGAQRVVPGAPGELLTRLEAVMPRGELLLPVRRTGDRLMLEPRRDPLGNIFRAMGVGGRRFDLVRVDSLVVSATPVDATKSVLRFDAVLSGARSMERTTVLIVGALLWLLVVAVAVPALVFSLVVPTFALATVGLLSVLAAGGTWLTWRGIKRRYRAMLGRVQMRLDALLDEAQAGRLSAPASLLDRLLSGR
ncbi:MAG: hypothetical protein K2R93_14025 [Gemmatimonadaceae bacterium]|nr:hypothetical protein [Gemmatimonadaceae bacterium]